MRSLILVLGSLAALLGVAFGVIPSQLDRGMNSVAHWGPYSTSERARALHQKLFIADLHDDALLWSRNILQRYHYGQSDLPRLREGRVALQVFATVTKTPKNMNFERNAGDTDNVTSLAMIQAWPLRTWHSLLERALWQAEKLHVAQAGSHGQLHIVRTQADLVKVFQSPAGGIAGLLATEGLHPLEGKLENLDRLYAAGFRMGGLTHFFDNELGGSAHGMEKGGLTPFGRQVVTRMEEKRMIVDLAHASAKVVADVLAMATRPVVFSHTGVATTCPGPRNLTDEQLRAIASNGGLIGIAYFDGAVCDITPAGIIKAIRHAVAVMGIKHVALGSDFNGAVHTHFDTTGLVLITQGLLEAGFSEMEIADIMGGNAKRFLLANLPEA